MRRFLFAMMAVALLVAACSTAPATTTTTTTEATTTSTTEAEHETDHDEEAEEAEEGDHETGHETDHDEAGSEGVREVAVSLTEFGVEIDGDLMDGETVLFVVTNDGVAAHDFEVTNAHAIEDHLAGGHGGHDEGGMEMGDKLTLEAGETGELLATIGPETNVAACLIPGHYESGMWADLSA